jgi:signal transduction histidine kinase
MNPPSASTWFYVVSLSWIAVATVALMTAWAAPEREITLTFPLALASVGIAASFWRWQGAVIGTGVSCSLLLLWRDANTDLTLRDLAGVGIYSATAMLLAILAMQRRSFEEQVFRSKLALEASLQREAALGRSKDEFLSLVAHELRNPAAVLVGASDLLIRHKVKDEDRHELEHDIHVEALRVERLIEDLLSLARFDQGIRLEAEPIRIGPGC